MKDSIQFLSSSCYGTFAGNPDVPGLAPSHELEITSCAIKKLHHAPWHHLPVPDSLKMIVLHLSNIPSAIPPPSPLAALDPSQFTRKTRREPRIVDPSRLFLPLALVLHGSSSVPRFFDSSTWIVNPPQVEKLQKIP
ncbi:hypothetical protein MW887_002893 [Aspergillus wentii]|nr:hypothetical protein MW887_002893 [Aspergillus wentii]